MWLDAFVNENLGEEWTSGPKSPVPWLSIGKNNDCSNLCHCDQMLIIIGTDGGGEKNQALFVGCTVRECVADVDAAIAPCPGKATAFRHGGIVHHRVGGARVHHDEHGVRLCFVPRSDEPITVAVISAAKYGGAFHITAYR